MPVRTWFLEYFLPAWAKDSVYRENADLRSELDKRAQEIRELNAYAKQGVELEFQGYLDEAKGAANSAAGAVRAVTDMTVEARALDHGQPATVDKSMKNGKVNLLFGLPRGEQGVPGPAGQTGPRGPQGAPGNGLTILGHYNTEAELRAAVAAPEPGEVYSVGTELPYDTYIFDGVANDWRNYGPLSGGGGGVLPENVVTSEGGASIEMEGQFGDAPHTITFTGEEMPPLTADDVEYKDGETVKDAIDGLFTSVSDGKALIASAITDKGVPTEKDAAFRTMHDNILAIQGGDDTSDATATPGDILGGKTAYTRSGKVEGIIPSLPAQTITPGTSDKTIANGQYLAGTQTIQGDPGLVSANIRKGVSIFGVPGAVESSFASVLTVKADIGAVVAATCGDTSLEALSTTGTVVLELPIEGIWKVTAVRGMAQYNTATIEVSSHYSAELTAALHVDFYATLTPLDGIRGMLSAASVGGYAIFGSGYKVYTTGEATVVNKADAYDTSLTHFTCATPTAAIYDGAAASAGDYAIFAGYEGVTAYSAPLSREAAALLSEPRRDLAATSFDGYALFGGGSYSKAYDSVDAYDGDLVRTTQTPLTAAMSQLAAAVNEKYAIFAGNAGVNAYGEKLVRTIATPLSRSRKQLAGARAGNYVLFAGGYSNHDTVDAYDLFLTRTTAEPLGAACYDLAGTTVRDFAVFGGGRLYTSAFSRYVNVYDPYLVRTSPKSLSASRASLAATSIGDYALFGGGEKLAYTGSPDKYSSVVDVYRYT